MDVSLRGALLNFIVNNMSKELLLGIEDAVLNAYSEAFSFVKRAIRNTPSDRLLGQSRRYLIDDRLAGIQGVGAAKVTTMITRGEHFVVINSDSITISHIELHATVMPRAAKHRTFLAHKNAILEPVSLDLFKDNSEPDMQEQLHLVVVVVRPSTYQDAGQPTDILVAIPYTNWKGFHLQISFKDLIQIYSDADTVVEQIDVAWPTLKNRLIEQEKKFGT